MLQSFYSILSPRPLYQEWLNTLRRSDSECCHNTDLEDATFSSRVQILTCAFYMTLDLSFSQTRHSSSTHSQIFKIFQTRPELARVKCHVCLQVCDKKCGDSVYWIHNSSPKASWSRSVFCAMASYKSCEWVLGIDHFQPKVEQQ